MDGCPDGREKEAMDAVLVEPHGEHEPHLPKSPRRAAVSAWVGSALEYYDFYIYGTAAALIFPRLFFPPGNPTAATIASLATFGAAYVARPVGAFILGHLGDTIGRKRVLSLTLYGMGAATFLIGVLPTYEQIGIAAPILLLILRMLQGLAVSGEQSSAALTTLEHAPANRRGFFTSFALAGTQAGNILATLVFIPVASLSTSALLSWGWRVPFLLSAVVVVVGVRIRRTLPESPAFEEQQQHHELPKAPLAAVFRNYTPDVLKVIFAAFYTVSGTIFSIYALTYGVNTMHLPRTALLSLLILVNLIALAVIPAAGRLADRFGRKPVFVIGVVGTAVMTWPFMWALSERDLILVYVFGVVAGIFFSCFGGAALPLWSEQFDTRVRMSGVAIGTQFGFALTGFAPAIAATMAGPGLRNWVPVAAFGCAAAVVAAIAALTMRETYKTPLYDLGRPATAVRRPGRVSPSV
jgi:MFS family permease